MTIKTVVPIQNDTFPSQPEESVLRTSTNTHRGLQISLPAHEALRPPTYAHDILEKAAHAQES